MCLIHFFPEIKFESTRSKLPLKRSTFRMPEIRVQQIIHVQGMRTFCTNYYSNIDLLCLFGNRLEKATNKILILTICCLIV